MRCPCGLAPVAGTAAGHSKKKKRETRRKAETRKGGVSPLSPRRARAAQGGDTVRGCGGGMGGGGGRAVEGGKGALPDLCSTQGDNCDDPRHRFPSAFLLRSPRSASCCSPARTLSSSRDQCLATRTPAPPMAADPQTSLPSFTLCLAFLFHLRSSVACSTTPFCLHAAHATLAPISTGSGHHPPQRRHAVLRFPSSPFPFSLPFSSSSSFPPLRRSPRARLALAITPASPRRRLCLARSAHHACHPRGLRA